MPKKWTDNFKDYTTTDVDDVSNAEKPDHYEELGKIDIYDLALAWNLNMLEGNILKYVVRKKGQDRLKDLQKAKLTLERLIEEERKF